MSCLDREVTSPPGAFKRPLPDTCSHVGGPRGHTGTIQGFLSQEGPSRDRKWMAGQDWMGSSPVGRWKSWRWMVVTAAGRVNVLNATELCSHTWSRQSASYHIFPPTFGPLVSTGEPGRDPQAALAQGAWPHGTGDGMEPASAS